MSENDDYLRPWASDMLRVGAVDNRGNLSERALAKIAGVSNATVSRTLKGLQTPGARTVEKIATALEIDPTEVWRRLGIERDHQAPYEPPSEAAFLSHRERKLVTEMIRVLVEGRHAQPEQTPVPADHDLPLADPPVADGATPDTGGMKRWTEAREAGLYDLAANNAPSKGKRLKREAGKLGEESQDPGHDDPA